MINAIEWRDDQLWLLDQRKLPQVCEFISYTTVSGVVEAIRDMVVRGAPAIGITAAYGVAFAAKQRFEIDPGYWQTAIEQDLANLLDARPTAVNLAWAVQRMRAILRDIPPNQAPVSALLNEAAQIHREDIAANHRIGDLGAKLLSAKSTVVTHCNAGALATGGYGTALGVIRSAWSQGKVTCVYADETRPWWQGARLTAWELAQDQIPVTLLVEGAVGHLLKTQKIAWVIVGADRIAANGDTANKIGTYNLALMARHHGTKMMVAAPISTIDMNVVSGDDIPIEIRSSDEILDRVDQAINLQGVGAWNPAFDVTPANLIDVIVTDKGVIEQPTTAKMQALMNVS